MVSKKSRSRKVVSRKTTKKSPLIKKKTSRKMNKKRPLMKKRSSRKMNKKRPLMKKRSSRKKSKKIMIGGTDPFFYLNDNGNFKKIEHNGDGIKTTEIASKNLRELGEQEKVFDFIVIKKNTTNNNCILKKYIVIVKESVDIKLLELTIHELELLDKIISSTTTFQDLTLYEGEKEINSDMIIDIITILKFEDTCPVDYIQKYSKMQPKEDGKPKGETISDVESQRPHAFELLYGVPSTPEDICNFKDNAKLYSNTTRINILYEPEQIYDTLIKVDDSDLTNVKKLDYYDESKNLSGYIYKIFASEDIKIKYFLTNNLVSSKNNQLSVYTIDGKGKFKKHEIIKKIEGDLVTYHIQTSTNKYNNIVDLLTNEFRDHTPLDLTKFKSESSE
jgi:hypothetical protein